MVPEPDMRTLMEAGAHFGHQTHMWDPRMKPYLFGARQGVHIIDLSRTLPLLRRALRAVRDVAARRGRILFVGSKRQASAPIAEAAQRCAQYSVSHRWYGGTLTNWGTIAKSLAKLAEIEAALADEEAVKARSKRETLTMTREQAKLERALGGVRDMGGPPDMMFVVDPNREALAVREAQARGIPIVALLDSNCDPTGIDYPIPANDDSSRSVRLFCDLIAAAALDGLAEAEIEGMPAGNAPEAPEESAAAPEAPASPAEGEDAAKDEGASA